MFSIIIKGIESTAISRLTDFFKGKTSLEPSFVFNVFSRAAKMASDQATKSDSLKIFATPLSYASKYMKELSDDLVSKGQGPLFFGDGRREERLQRRLDNKEQRQIARINKRQHVQEARIRKRQALKEARQIGNLDIAGEREQRAKELGIDSQINTFLGWLGGHGAVKPNEIFQTIGQLTDVMADSIKKVQPFIGSKSSQYAEDFINEGNKIEVQSGSGLFDKKPGGPFGGPRLPKKEIKKSYKSCVQNLKDKGYKNSGARMQCRGALQNYMGMAASYDPGVKYDVLEHPNPGSKGSGKVKKKTVGTRDQVWEGLAMKTSGGLTKKDLMKNKAGKIVSKKMHEKGKALLKTKKSKK